MRTDHQAKGLPWPLKLAAASALAAALALGATDAHSTPAARQRVTPVPASATRLDLNCPIHSYPGGFTRVCAAKHVRRDAIGNLVVRAAGSVATYNRHGRPVAHPLALRVVLAGDRTGLRRASPLESIRRTRRGPARVTSPAQAQARVLAFVYRGGRWRQHLVYSGTGGRVG
jgi:hypothetical protein